MQSPEYPDLPFVSARAYGSGRQGYAVQYVVVHYTAGSERSTSAEDGALYDARRTDGTSCHYFHDQNSTVQCVYTWNRANSAYHYGNRLGIHHELCGTQQTREQWLDPASDGTLWQAAKQIARDCQKYGLPVRKLTPAEMLAGQHGICGHADVTLAYGLGDHMDPGDAFPWDVLLARVQQFLAPTPTPQQEDEDMVKVIFAPGRGWARVTGTDWVDIDDSADQSGPNTDPDGQPKATVNAIVWGNSVVLTDAQWDSFRETYPA